jgi:hypothetical protein
VHHRGGGLQGETNDVVRGTAAEVRDKADAARIVFFDRVGRGGVTNEFVRDGSDLARAMNGGASSKRSLDLYFTAN